MTDTPPFDRLFEEGTGNGLYALAVSNWETVSNPSAFFIKNMARQALTRMAHAAAERPDEVDAVLDHLLASATEKAFLAEQFPPYRARNMPLRTSLPDGLKICGRQ